MSEQDAESSVPADVLTAAVREGFARAGFAEADVPGGLSVVATANPAFGDYQCNAAMPLAKAVGRAPRRIAESVIAALPAHPCLGRAEAAGPGFINLFLDDAWLCKQGAALGTDPRLGVPRTGRGRTIVMDYGGPNITKPLHIGHLRSPNIGGALDRMYRLLGYRVIADSHLGDWGTQFGITIMGYREYGDAEAMERAPMEELERVYVKSYERSRRDEAWLTRCREELVKLQAGDAENTALWKRFVALSLEELDRIYGRLGVSFDLVRGESYYRDRLRETVAVLRERGLARPSEGALAVFLEDEKLPPCIVRKSDGGFNYATTDIATVMSRVEEFQPDRIVYVTDERQQLHFRQVFAICRRLGYDTALEHVWFGLMRLPEGTFSTREGTVIRLEALLDEAERRALAVVQAASPDMPAARQAEVARAVGVGAVKYADLSQNPQSVVTFTWDKALALDGNSGPYLQYAYARIAGVRNKYDARFPGRDPETEPLRLSEPVERELLIRLVRFPETVRRAAESGKPSIVTDYLYDLAQVYSAYYQAVPFLKAPAGLRESRVRLGGVTARVLRRGLELLGIEVLERI
ncbi:MAG: arginine--tRNA ligase [Lentisphaerae bacterium]|nr:arginine--tRNA ligase [Lentisphaerota bacterium]